MSESCRSCRPLISQLVCDQRMISRQSLCVAPLTGNPLDPARMETSHTGVSRLEIGLLHSSVAPAPVIYFGPARLGKMGRAKGMACPVHDCSRSRPVSVPHAVRGRTPRRCSRARTPAGRGPIPTRSGSSSRIATPRLTSLSRCPRQGARADAGGYPSPKIRRRRLRSRVQAPALAARSTCLRFFTVFIVVFALLRTQNNRFFAGATPL